MPIVIDGWNLIRSDRSDIPDDDVESLDAAAALISFLADFQKRHADPIVVIFDSSREFLDIDYKNTPGLAVRAAKNADTYIKKYIDKTPERQRRNLRVVSSDKDIYYYAKGAYATPVKSEEFWQKLTRLERR